MIRFLIFSVVSILSSVTAISAIFLIFYHSISVFEILFFLIKYFYYFLTVHAITIIIFFILKNHKNVIYYIFTLSTFCLVFNSDNSNSFGEFFLIIIFVLTDVVVLWSLGVRANPWFESAQTDWLGTR